MRGDGGGGLFTTEIAIKRHRTVDSPFEEKEAGRRGVAWGGIAREGWTNATGARGDTSESGPPL